jgi:hypothetical protein
MTRLGSQKDDLVPRLLESRKALETDRRRYWELRKHVVEIQEIIFRFLEKVEDVIMRRAGPFLGSGNLLEVASNFARGEETIDALDDEVTMRTMRARDMVTTRSLKMDMENLRKVWGEISILERQIKVNSVGRKGAKRNPPNKKM